MNQHWSPDAVIYHIYAPSLARAELYNDYAEQKHMLPEIEKWLPHIKNLGCNTVLFSPILKSRTHGYDVTDYFQIDNRIGTNDDFKSLVSLFHENGVRVLLDSVFNHCGRDFFAFQELRNGNRGYADWFSGVDFGRSSPMGDPFTYNTWSGHYELPKFNLWNEAARRYLLDAAGYWIDEFDVDGMRLDAANELDFGFMRDLRCMATGKKPDFWLMGEVVHGDYSRWVNSETLDSVTNYKLFKSMFSSHNDNNLYELAFCLQHSVPNQGLPLFNFLDNHDQPRITSNVKEPDFIKTLYALMFTIPGIPSVYYGSEWGVRGVKDRGSDQPLRPYIDIENPPSDIPWLEGYIRKLAEARQGSKALKYGGYRQICNEYRRPFVFARIYEGEHVFVAINIENREETVKLSDYHSGAFIDLLSGERIDPDEARSIKIAPYSPLILTPAAD